MHAVEKEARGHTKRIRFRIHSMSRDEIILPGETSGDFFIGWLELDGFQIYDEWLIVPPSPSQHAKNSQPIHYQISFDQGVSSAATILSPRGSMTTQD